MSTSQAASLHLVPLLARIVLAAAFIPAGWNKLMKEATFEGENAAVLRSLGVGGSPAQGTGSQAPDAGGPGTTRPDGPAAGRDRSEPANSKGAGTSRGSLGPSATGGGWSMLAAAPPVPAGTAPAKQAEPAKKEDTRPKKADEIDSEPVESAQEAPAAGEATPAPAPAPPKTETGESGAATSETALEAAPVAAPLTAASLHHVTLMVHRQGMAYPVYQAYLATAAELIGGSLILLGLFSRIWGLALAGVLAVAFWLTSWPLLAAGDPFTVLFSLPIPDFNRLFCQAGLFVLAFGVFLTGPGAVSIDRAIFRPVEDAE